MANAGELCVQRILEYPVAQVVVAQVFLAFILVNYRIDESVGLVKARPGTSGVDHVRTRYASRAVHAT